MSSNNGVVSNSSKKITRPDVSSFQTYEPAGAPAPVAVDPLAALREQLAQLQAQNDALRASKAQAGNLAMKVSEKGAVSVYGLGRFPVTLYREQWERLLGHAEQVKAFIQENASQLSVKDAVKK